MSVPAWEERAIVNSAAVIRSKQRSVDRVRAIIEATRNTNYETRETFTVQQLAKLAGVSLQTFYRYFPSKDDLLLALLEDSVRRNTDKIRLLSAQQTRHVDRLRIIITAPLVGRLGSGQADLLTREHHRLAERFPSEVEKIVQIYIDLVAETCAAGVEAGEIPPVDTGSASRNIGLLMLSRFHHAALDMFVDDIDHEAEQLWEFCRRSLGIGAP